MQAIDWLISWQVCRGTNTIHGSQRGISESVAAWVGSRRRGEGFKILKRCNGPRGKLESVAHMQSAKELGNHQRSRDHADKRHTDRPRSKLHQAARVHTRLLECLVRRLGFKIYTYWLAGGGAKKGIYYGETDEVGLTITKDPVQFHDLHATVLHLMGLNPARLTYRYAGRDQRLTDVSGKVVPGLIA